MASIAEMYGCLSTDLLDMDLEDFTINYNCAMELSDQREADSERRRRDLENKRR